jgi:hypothetical protein
VIVVKRIFAALLLACAFMATLGNAVGNSVQNQQDWPKIIVFDLVAAGFGGFLLWSAYRSARSRRRTALIAGYVRSHPRVNLHALAGYLSISRAQAEEELLAIIERDKLDLIIHERGDDYVNRKLLPQLDSPRV